MKKIVKTLKSKCQKLLIRYKLKKFKDIKI
jgi:hypothetical protein